MTEQAHFRSFFGRFWLAWVIALIVGIALGYVVTKTMKPTYEGAVAITMQRSVDPSQDSGNFYRYDGYYAQQSISLARNNLVAWLHSPKTVYDIYTQAGLQTSAQQSSTALARLFTIPDSISPEADVTLSAKTSDQATRLSQALVDYAQKNYHATGYQLAMSDPLIVAVQPPKTLIVLASAFGLLVIAFVVTLVVHYFTPSRAN